MKKSWLLLLCICVGFAVNASAGQKFTYIDLINKLTDLESLSVLPSPGEKCMQFSSYDRKSKYDEKNKRYVGWNANADHKGMVREENGLSVMAEMEGPGCIWRIWSAEISSGHVKIYLDGAAEPAVDLPFRGYFDCKNPPFVYPSLVNVLAKGYNNYVPIPYQKSCKIVAQKGWGNYYHFGYTTFPKGTIMPTFKRDLSAEEKSELERVDNFLTNNAGIDPAGQRKDEKNIVQAVTIPAGKSVTVTKLEGRYAITSLKIKMGSPSPEDVARCMREITLNIYWDNEKKPSVWSPLGDFFGTAPGINKYKSLPMGMTDDGFYSLWYMPFAKNAVVEFCNDGKTDYSLEVIITYAPVTRPINQLSRFHAKWHRDAFLPTEPTRKIDWTMLKTTGRGRFCGVKLNIWNPKGGWWGEGDEKFFVDGEKFPSTFGTGSEDYFGYAWGNTAFFENAYHSQTFNNGSFRGHESLNRWHISDNVPFQKSFEGDIEKYYSNERPALYDCVVYWYQMPSNKDLYEPVPMSDRVGYYIPAKIYMVSGAIEAENMQVLEKTGGDTSSLDMISFADGKWSNNAQLYWVHANLGNKLTLALPVTKAGKYELKIQFTKSWNYGIVQTYLDDNKIGEPIDMYSARVDATGALSFGVHDLTEGQHKLMFEITGSSPKSKSDHRAGIDYVLLEPAE